MDQHRCNFWPMPLHQAEVQLLSGTTGIQFILKTQQQILVALLFNTLGHGATVPVMMLYQVTVPAGGVGGGRLAHTFTTSTEQEQSRTVTLTLDAHNVALPSDIPTDDSNTYKIYDTHTPEVSLDDNSGVNELAH